MPIDAVVATDNHMISGDCNHRCHLSFVASLVNRCHKRCQTPTPSSATITADVYLLHVLICVCLLHLISDLCLSSTSDLRYLQNNQKYIVFSFFATGDHLFPAKIHRLPLDLLPIPPDLLSVLPYLFPVPTGLFRLRPYPATFFISAVSSISY
ncbi:unnamed protein product [Lactuca virosa]|uniref:Uncharacterized protein n=1 Tax=Lactuca virosa TaxID=75947 RepID=A0AAU9PG50_9ASTR|nr:unnamed protein product [Lactuca virosa]